MKIGILGCADYPHLEAVQNFIHNIQFLYRPMGNMDDEYEEPIIILSRLRNSLDCTAVIQAAKANFTVKHMEDVSSLIEEADRVYVFISLDPYNGKSDIDRLMEARVPFEVIFAKENDNDKRK